MQTRHTCYCSEPNEIHLQDCHWGKHIFYLNVNEDVKIFNNSSIISNIQYIKEDNKLKVIVSTEPKWKENVCNIAAQEGSLKILKWGYKNGCKITKDTFKVAARNGHLHILQWLQKNDCEWNNKACTLAVKGEHIKVIKWLLDHYFDPIQIYNAAVKLKSKKINQWLKRKNYSYIYEN
mgnify:CR=1 FL=1